MILGAHLKLWSEIFSLQYLPKGRWITIGYQDIHPKVRQIDGFQFADLKQMLEQRGVDVTTLDFFDQRADLKFDLNEPVGEEYNEAFDMLLDIGSIEHVYDTRQAFINYLSLVKTGGDLRIHTPVSVSTHLFQDISGTGCTRSTRRPSENPFDRTAARCVTKSSRHLPVRSCLRPS